MPFEWTAATTKVKYSFRLFSGHPVEDGQIVDRKKEEFAEAAFKSFKKYFFLNVEVYCFIGFSEIPTRRALVNILKAKSFVCYTKNIQE